MPAQRDSSVLRKEVHLGHSSISTVSISTMKVLSSVALLGLGAGLFFMLPEDSNNESPVASAAATAPVPEPTADESFCNKQAWPYVDQRCAKRVEAARGTRQVRIVTDKGHSVTTVTPLPIVEPKKPASPAPTVAQAERPMGPPATPTVNEASPPAQTVAAAPPSAPAPQNSAPKAAAAPAPSVQLTVAPANRPAATEAMARENPNPRADTRNASVPPSAASNAPMAPGFDAFAEVPAKKSKSARAAEKAEKREAKRRKAIEAYNSGVPDEVVRAVEEASANDGRRGRGIVTLGSPNGGQRIFLVPREEASGW